MSSARREQDRERRPLLGHQSLNQDYSSFNPTSSSRPADPTFSGSLPRSPFASSRILRFLFFLGALLLLVSITLFLLLLLNLFIPVPLLLPPHRSPSVLALWLSITSISVLAPSLFVFELSARLTRLVHAVNFLLLGIALIVMCAVEPLRKTHSWLGISCLLLNLFITLWCILTSHSVSKVTYPVAISALVAEPMETGLGYRYESRAIITQIPSQRAQRRCTRYIKVFLAFIGSTLVTALLSLMTFNLCLDAADSGFKPLGNLTTVSTSKAFERRPTIYDPPTVGASHYDYKMHVACRFSDRGNQTDDSKRHDLGPTALVMTDRGVAGQIGGEWVWDMVRRSTGSDDDPRDQKEGNQGSGASIVDGSGDEGRFSLNSVCIWDRIGYGHTDFMGHPFNIKVQTRALHHALVDNQIISPTPDSKAGQGDQGDSEGGGFGDKKRGGKGKKGETRRLMLISTGFGALFAHDFATTYPELVHSQVVIDGETPETWWTKNVSVGSGLRAGIDSPGHTAFSKLYNDLMPALVEPLGILRLAGLFAGKSPFDRILSPMYRGGSPRLEAGGGGFRLVNGGSNGKLLVTSWYERLDANLGQRSPNYKLLESTQAEASRLLASRPTAVISSFWKIHADLDGWAKSQVERYVEPAKKAGTLIGWWRVGNRLDAKGGGDTGEAMGICGDQVGRVFCQEAVRKVLATEDL
ncbi:hypothetical protein IE53DRAFT_389590 [Violaceomyces palustris]|uniref:Uncharacterized protein n=1 Tax=Violaceomyces palustris TaxID=1673888 RepID=A0ACD0NR18_9BASI|nr:hypothetical protein IE53DRAFT_389590 [Violaceomyces palustris]